jgi:hypothetical protein
MYLHDTDLGKNFKHSVRLQWNYAHTVIRNFEWSLSLIFISKFIQVSIFWGKVSNVFNVLSKDLLLIYSKNECICSYIWVIVNWPQNNSFSVILIHQTDLDRGRGRQRRRENAWRQNGVAYPYRDTTRHFHVVFDVRVLDLNLSTLLN